MSGIINNQENVARVLFSPRMIVDGKIQPEAFRLRDSINEDYLSVMRMAFPTWKKDVGRIPQRKNRKLYGYAEMNVGEISGIRLKGVRYDVRECPQSSFSSHAGIFISVHGEKLIGGNLLKGVQNAMEQDYLVLAIQRELVDIAQKKLWSL